MSIGRSLSKLVLLDDDDDADGPITAQVCTFLFSKYMYTNISLIFPKSTSV
jgi:hypothetical protein